MDCFIGVDIQGHSTPKILLSPPASFCGSSDTIPLKPFSLFIASCPSTSIKACYILQTPALTNASSYIHPNSQLTAQLFKGFPLQSWNNACHVSDVHSPRSSQPATNEWKRWATAFNSSVFGWTAFSLPCAAFCIATAVLRASRLTGAAGKQPRIF